jgi:hypothetical protein
MATEAEATREAKAKVVAAQGEQNASVIIQENKFNDCSLSLFL